MGEELEFTAGAQEEGVRLDVALAARSVIGSRARAARLIEAGRVTVEGEAQPKRRRLATGERVVASLEAGPEGGRVPDRSIGFEVAFEDDDLIVVDKPAGLVVHPGAGHRAGTLADALADRAAGGSEPWREGIVHRLDRDTSGLLVVAKAEAVHRALQDMIRRREVRREYLALVDGRPGSRTGTIDAPIGRDRARRTLVSTRSDHARPAVTHFEVAEALVGTALLRVRLETGRTHQIRAHLQAIGHPVCGDRDYGGGACGEHLGLGRQFLHSATLAFVHPTTGAELVISSPLPADLAGALAAARRENPSRPLTAL